MDFNKVSFGDDAPEVINVIIEIRKGDRNKYEFDKATGCFFLDRVNGTTLGYPADYGFIPNTLCEDGDPLDALLVIDEPVHLGVVVPSRPVGVLYMVDDGEKDEKLVCVPVDDVSKDHIKDLNDLGENFQKVVQHYYAHYKDWKNGWQGADVKFDGWGDAAAAKEAVTKSIDLARK